LESDEDWSVGEFEGLLRFVRRKGLGSDEVEAVFSSLTVGAIEGLHLVDVALWESLVRQFCDWTQRAFEFGFCDVLVNRLERIVALGSLGSQSRAVLAAARLGSTHNRFYVMRRVREMCDTSMDRALAERVALEIQIEKEEEHFNVCSRKRGPGEEPYHSALQGVVS